MQLEELEVALYKYSASTTSTEEEFNETGTVIADSEEEARKKIKALHFDKVRLRKVTGIKALFGHFSATVR